MIIAAYAGIGKTTLARLHPDKTTDFVCMPYKYVLDDEEKDYEASKANLDYLIRDDWPLNYVSAIKRNMSNKKMLLIPSEYLVLMFLRSEKIPYTLCYPHKDAKEAYLKRFMDRGNTQEFIDIFIGRWNDFIEGLEKDSYGRHIVLKPHQYLSDVIDAGFLEGKLCL